MKEIQQYWSERKFGMVTLHQKEALLSPLFLSAFQQPVVSIPFNTDNLGTFSGEIERPADQLTTARLKIQAAPSDTGCNVLLASEGAFFPHPDIPYITVNRELLVLQDIVSGYEIVAQYNSYDTNAFETTVQSWEEIEQLLTRNDFTENAFILMTNEAIVKDRTIYKGIQNQSTLKQYYDALIAQGHKQLIFSTDLRAMYNISRQKNIIEAGKLLIELMLSTCEQCNTPGFQIQELERGLPCAWCLTPTTQVQYYVYRCNHCGFEKKKASEKSFSDPGNCNNCNP